MFTFTQLIQWLSTEMISTISQDSSRVRYAHRRITVRRNHRNTENTVHGQFTFRYRMAESTRFHEHLSFPMSQRIHRANSSFYLVTRALGRHIIKQNSLLSHTHTKQLIIMPQNNAFIQKVFESIVLWS